MDESSLISAIERLEGIATKYGPTVTNVVSAVADTLSGPGANSGTSKGVSQAPALSHLGVRLHGVAAVFESLFGSIEDSANRAASAIDVASPSKG